MVHAIKIRVCAVFIGLVVLTVGIIGGVETQLALFHVLADRIEDEYPDWVTVYTED